MAAVSPRASRWLRTWGLGLLVIVLALGAVAGRWVLKVRAETERSVIICHLAALVSAAEQYCLETHREYATYDDVVGPGKWIAKLEPVAGEEYRTMPIRPGQPLSVRTRDGREISYTPRR